MKKYFVTLAIIILVVTLFIISKNSLPAHFVNKQNHFNSDLAVITEPDAGIAPILSLIQNASISVDLVMYELEDKQIEQALVADEKRGVAVRVLLSNGYKGQSFPQNQKAYDFLRTNGVSVEWTQNYFALTHEKSLVVDGNTALIMTFNFTPQYYSTSRDFGIIDRDQNDIEAMHETFDSDWQGSGVAAGDGDELVWSPGSEPAMIALINSAHRSLDIYNEEMADPYVTKALIDAAERGVSVDIDMTYSDEWKNAFEELTTAGVHVRTYDPKASLYIHAKMILVDGTRAFIGSENFSQSSLDDNRELGIVLTDSKVIAALTAIFNNDWKSATLFSF